MFYVQRGSVPRQRHTQHRAPDGSLYAEELFGVEGFTGRSSLLYHLVPPTQTHRIEPVGPVTLERVDDEWHHHRLVKTAGLEASRSRGARPLPAVLQQRRRDGRHPAGRLDARRACSIATATPTRCSSSTRAAARFESVFGTLTYGPGDYLVIPIGTTWRLTQDEGVDHRILYLESPAGDRRRPGATSTTTASCSSTRPTATATCTRPTWSSRAATRAISSSTSRPAG